MTDTWLGWYFSDETETLRNGDGRQILVGITHEVDCKPELCVRGLHASASVLDALEYSHGTILWRVSLSGVIKHGDDKSCATKRTYNARIDATDLLRTFARKCALGVIQLWNAPQIVRDYLETGNEELRDSARSAAQDSALAAARSAAWSAAQDAAQEEQRQLLEQMALEAIAGATRLRSINK